MNLKNKKMILSASRVKQYLDCSWLFYQTYFKKVPENTHPKTKLGSLAHTILEAFTKKKHEKHYLLALKNKTVYASPAISRLVKMFLSKNPDVTPKIIADLDELIFVALNHDFECKDAKEILKPEYDFNIDFGDFAIKGFMDRVVIYDNIAVIRDYKTQSKRFTSDQMEFNIQASFYQTAIKHCFGLPAKVEFLLLRFPANKKDSQRYIQSVEPMSDGQINGFKFYLSHINKDIEKLDEENAKDNLKAQKDIGFCKFVCSLREPFDYWAKIDKEGKILESKKFEIDNGIKDGEYVERRKYSGCPWFFNDEGKQRNFQ